MHGTLIQELPFPNDHHILVSSESVGNFDPLSVCDAGVDGQRLGFVMFDDKDGFPFCVAIHRLGRQHQRVGNFSQGNAQLGKGAGSQSVVEVWQVDLD